MLPVAGPSRLGYVLPRHLSAAASRSASRLCETGPTRNASDLARPATSSSTSSGPQLSRVHVQAPAFRQPRRSMLNASAEPSKSSPGEELGVTVNSIPGTSTRPTSDVRATMRAGKGTGPALEKAHKYLYHVRRRSNWKTLSLEEHPKRDMDADWKALDRTELSAPLPFTPAMVTRADDTHPYVRAYEETMLACLEHPFGAASARSLLKRQLAEGVPLTEAASLVVLEHMPVPLNIIGTLLPSPTPPTVLAATIRSAVRQGILETPDTFRQIITATLEEGGERTEPQHWDWNIWAALISAHVGDLRGAVATLLEFKAVVAAARTAAIENEQQWPDNRASVIGDAYTNVMHLWIANRSSRRRSAWGSNLPALLAADMDALLAPGPAPASTSSSPTPVAKAAEPYFPHQFFTAWLNAERFSSTSMVTGRGDLIWSAMAGQSIQQTVQGGKPPRPLDTPAYLALFKLLKLKPPKSYRPLALNVPNTARSGLLSAVALHPKPDLPLVMALVSSTAPPPPGSLDVLFRERRFDVAASAIIRAARHMATTSSPSSRSSTRALLPAPYPLFPYNASDGRRSIAPGEWDWLTDCLRMHQVQGRDIGNHNAQSTANGSTSGNAGNSASGIALREAPSLPLSAPMASLVAPTAEQALGQPQPTKQNPMVVTHNQTYRPDWSRQNAADALMPALVRVLRDSIVCEARVRGAQGDYAAVLNAAMAPLEPLLGDKRAIECDQ